MADEATIKMATGPCLTRSQLHCVIEVLPPDVIECMTKQGRYLIVNCGGGDGARASGRRGAAKAKATRAAGKSTGKKRR